MTERTDLEQAVERRWREIVAKADELQAKFQRTDYDRNEDAYDVTDWTGLAEELKAAEQRGRLQAEKKLIDALTDLAYRHCGPDWRDDPAMAMQADALAEAEKGSV